MDQRAGQFVDSDQELPTIKQVLEGTRDLIVEAICERIDVRQRLRTTMHQTGMLVVSKYVEQEEEASETVDGEPEPPPASSTSKETAPPTRLSEAAPETSLAPTSASSDDEEDGGSGEQGPSEQRAGEDETDESTPSPSVEPPDGPGDGESLDAATDEPPSPSAAARNVEPPEPESEVTPTPESSTAAKSSVVKLPSGAMTAEQRRRQRREARRRKREQLEASFKDYFDFREPIQQVPPHRILAINRGERVRVLRVRVKVDPEALFEQSCELLISPDTPQRPLLESCIREAISRPLVASLDREIRRELTEKAEQHALNVFARNLRHLLLQPPVRRRVLAIDPGLRFGCKTVALDEYGGLLADTTIHAIGDAERVEEGRRRLAALIDEHGLEVIAIGNGTGCRQAETTVAALLEERFADRELAYVIVNEAGASIYSTSDLATRELPNCDARLRGAISIGRRLLDPLSELVKIEPGNLGVGMYQHDVRQKHLQDSLDEVVISCVNYVGVDLNTASPSLLRYVSGMNQRTAREVYEYRQQNGPFRSREQLKSVPGVGESTYEQAAGFLMVYDGDCPFDATWVHPESYDQGQRLLEHLNCSLEALREQVAKQHSATITSRKKVQVIDREPSSEASTVTDATELSPTGADQPLPAGDHPQVVGKQPAEDEASTPNDPPDLAEPTVEDAEPATSNDVTITGTSSDWLQAADDLNSQAIAEQLGIGKLLVDDLITALRRAGRDPREAFPPPLFRRGIMRLEDLLPDMELTATVLNVVDFGAFVDIGLRDSGLIHISQLADRFIRDPHEVVSVGDTLRVWVMKVDRQRRRVSLTTFPPGSSEREARPAALPPPKRRGRPAAKTSQEKTGRDKFSRGGRSGRPSVARPPKRRPPPPAVPITDGMKNGSEPMRTFGDLAQFFETTKSSDETDRKRKPKKK